MQDESCLRGKQPWEHWVVTVTCPGVCTVVKGTLQRQEWVAYSEASYLEEAEGLRWDGGRVLVDVT